MNVSEQVYAQARLLAGDLEEKRQALLKVLCSGTAGALALRLRKDADREACEEALIGAASLMALAALEETGGPGEIQEFRAGDLTVKQGSTGGKTNCQGLREQAEAIIGPYLQDRFSFQGV